MLFFVAVVCAECNEHPHLFFLFFEIAGEHVGCNHIIGVVGKFNQLTFFFDNKLVGVKYFMHRFMAVGDVVNFFHASYLKVFAEFVFGHTT